MTPFSLFLHGTPSSTCNTSKSLFDGLEERIAEEFFNNADMVSASSVFVYETRKWSGFMYSVYTIYKRVRGYGGRSGCYCALTLILKDKVCNNFKKLYDDLKELYINEIQGKLGVLKEDRFLLPSFAEIKGFERLENKIKELTQSCLFIDFSNDYCVSNYSPTPKCFNISDLISEEFSETLLHDGKVFVSESYESLKDKAHRINEEQNSSQNRNEQQGNHQAEESSDNHKIQSQNNSDSAALWAISHRLDGIENQIRYSDNKHAKGNLMDEIKTFRLSDWFNVGNFVLLSICLFCLCGLLCQRLAQSNEVRNPLHLDVVENDSLKKAIVAKDDSLKALNVQLSEMKDSLNTMSSHLSKQKDPKFQKTKK